MLNSPVWLKSLVVSGVCAVLASASFAADWPRFRGPNGTGISTEKEIPENIQEADALWKVALPGSGNGSPIVVNGRVYLQTSSADDSARLLVCFDLKTGKILWQKDSPGGKGKIHKKNSLASSTPACDGKLVAVGVWDGESLSVVAYDVNGKFLWSQKLGNFKSQHGAGHSPIIYKDKVIIANDQDGFAELVALKAGSGDVAWKTARKAHRSSYSTPLLLDRGGQTELLVGSTTSLDAYDLDSGESRWSWAWEGNQLRMVGSPIISGNLAYLCGGDGSGARAAVAVKLGEKGKTISNQLVWEEGKSFPYVPTMLAFEKHVYYVNDGGIAACYEADTGKEVWKKRLGSGFSASPILVDGKIYAASESGELFVFAAAAEFHQLSSSNLGESLMATPAVADGRLIVRGQKHLFCFGKK